ncbi:MAG: type I DNA topoisomerase, partial [Anaerolineae bacterium]
SKAGSSGIRGKCPQCGSAVFRPSPGGGRPRTTTATPAAGKPKAKTKAKTTRTARAAAAPEASAPGHGRKLVIVESPAKARTIQRYLGRDFNVKASVGHVRDLLRSRLSVDVEQDFEPTYRVPNDKKAVVKELKAAVAGAPQVFLATDPDREGEAIAWHLMAATELDGARARRVVFHEITRDAIQHAFAAPREIDMNLVDAQQARRVLDRLVGYKLSPLLWQKVRSRLSAGRVQSVAVRLVVEREREITAFVPEEYWTIDASLRKVAGEKDAFRARLQKINGEDLEITSGERAEAVTGELKGAAYSVAGVKLGTKRRSPSAPFITSTLQQEAARVLGFQAARTMRIAQQLYEGVEIGPEGSTGLITYMRTDSVNVAESALAEVRGFVRDRFGDRFVPEQPVRYRTRSKMAQEAHEAVRPTSALRTPEEMAHHLSKDQLALYRLIWRRFVASQMQPAVYDTIAVDVLARPVTGTNRYGLRASGSHLQFPGFLVVFGDSAQKEDEPLLPPLEQGEALKLLKLLPEQHFTEPPPRYTEASLIRELESKGIGRPSTYAAIISTIISRGYVERDRRTLMPTETAFVVNDLLVAQFPDVMDVGFTAQMEDRLDDVAAGKKQWVPVVADFYGPFEEHLQRAATELEPAKMQDEPAGIDCEHCGAPMVIKYGRFGKFIGCSRYPECKTTKPFLLRVGVSCPDCGGEIVERRSHKGRRFYGCDRYPQCRFASYTQPVAQRCEKCGAYMVRQGRDRARCSDCKATAPLREEAPVAEAAVATS